MQKVDTHLQQHAHVSGSMPAWQLQAHQRCCRSYLAANIALMRYWLQQDWKRTEGAGREGFHGDRLLHCVAATNKSPEFVMDQPEQPNAQPLCSSAGGFLAACNCVFVKFGCCALRCRLADKQHTHHLAVAVPCAMRAAVMRQIGTKLPAHHHVIMHTLRKFT